MSSAGDIGSPPDRTSPLSKSRIQSPLDYRNGDLVSRLLAATPPYLYNMPLVPQSFFFSEMLRSFVQAKGSEQLSQATGATSPPAPRPAHHQRRSRKRLWRESIMDNPPPMSSPPSKYISQIMDKPLELTTNSKSSHSASQSSPQEDMKPPPCPTNSPPSFPPPPPLLLPPCGLLPLPSHESSLQNDMLLPPPPPLWYPPLYPLPPQPPYGIDPLHFFIDLRVSGHIWDRKLGKDASASPIDATVHHAHNQSSMSDEKPQSKSSPGPSSTSTSSLVKHTKHCSAFSVPQPRSRSLSPKKEQTSHCRVGTNYVLQNLSKIYQNVREKSADNHQEIPKTKEETKQEEDEEDKERCKDLRALIGLELVVDYVKHEGGPKSKDEKNPTQQAEDETDEKILALNQNTNTLSSQI